MSSPSPRGNKAKERRHFTADEKKECWKKADVLLGRREDRWRKDPAGNVVGALFTKCKGCLCHEYDHIVPASRGGRTSVDNCQILQTRVNRSKSNKEGVDQTELQGFSCDIKFTDKELDVIEMAIYGDVARPDKKCKCKSVAEMLRNAKSKEPACELPYDHSSS